MKKHLRFNLYGAFLSNEKRHAQTVMKELGITYQHATPQTIGDQWWFWNCENIPSEMPSFLTELNIDPMNAVGYGLSEETALSILTNKETK